MPNKQNSNLRGKCIMVLGGNGFIGRHIVERLKTTGATVLVGTRATQGCLKPYEREIRLHNMMQAGHWIETLTGIDLVINAVGILRERRGETYEAVHHLAVKTLVQACAKLRTKLVHISVLGLHDGLDDPFSITKKLGEQELIESEIDWHIIRASLVEGAGAYGGSWFERVARWPVHFIPEKHANISPVDVSVIANKVLQVICDNRANFGIDERIHEVSNGVVYLLPDYFVALNGGKRRPRILVPDLCVRLAARICDLFKITPLTYGHYELLTYDSCPGGLYAELTVHGNKGEDK